MLETLHMAYLFALAVGEDDSHLSAEQERLLGKRLAAYWIDHPSSFRTKHRASQTRRAAADQRRISQIADDEYSSSAGYGGWGHDE